jgi:hypothetical protein
METDYETMQNLLEIVLKSKLIRHKSWYQSTLITKGYSCLVFAKVFSTGYSTLLQITGRLQSDYR